jgi:hypothetical protein
MEWALQVLPSGKKEPVTITDMLKLGEDVARQNTYVCPSVSCEVPVFPIIPQKQKSGRQRAQRPHFRTGRKKKHVSDCGADGTTKKRRKKTTKDQTHLIHPEVEALL